MLNFDYNSEQSLDEKAREKQELEELADELDMSDGEFVRTYGIRDAVRRVTVNAAFGGAIDVFEAGPVGDDMREELRLLEQEFGRCMLNWRRKEVLSENSGAQDKDVMFMSASNQHTGELFDWRRAAKSMKILFPITFVFVDASLCPEDDDYEDADMIYFRKVRGQEHLLWIRDTVTFPQVYPGSVDVFGPALDKLREELCSKKESER